MNPLIITVAPTGAEASRSDNPNIPLTVDDIVSDAVASEREGASLIHIHGRDSEGLSSLEPGILSDIVAGVRESTGLIVQLSTGGGVLDSFDDRLAVVELQPDSCSLTCGSLNFGTEIFRNPWSLITELYTKMQSLGVLPEFEIFELGHLTTLGRLLDEFGLPHNGQVHCNLVMGVPGGMPGTPAMMTAALGMLPTGASWSATGIGRSTIPVMLSSLALGGNLRVGMEDVLRYSREELVCSNAQLVRRAADLARLAQRPIADSLAARGLLGF